MGDVLGRGDDDSGPGAWVGQADAVGHPLIPHDQEPGVALS